MRRIVASFAALAAIGVAAASDGFKSYDKTGTAAFERPSSGRGGPVPVPYSTGFEASEGFVLGTLGGQQGWAGLANRTVPFVSDLDPFGGTQHVRINDDPLEPPGFAGVLGFSPSHVAGVANEVSMMVNISNTGGADYFVNPQSPALAISCHRVDFNFGDPDADGVPGDILVFNDSNGPAAGGVVFVNTTVEYTPNVYKELRIRFLGNAMVETYYDGALIATTTVVHSAGGVPGNTFEEVVLLDDQFQDPGEFGDFDNFSVIPEPASLALLALGGLMALRRRS